MREGTSRRASGAPDGGRGVCAAVALGLSVADALAQGWGWWPWSQPEPRRRASRSIARRRARRCPRGSRRRDNAAAAAARAKSPAYGGQRMSNICLQLEQRLVAETQGGGQGREHAAQDRERHAPARAPAPDRAAAAQPRRLLGPVPVLAHAAAHAALHRSSPTRSTAPASASPTSRPSAARSWARGDRSYQDDIIRELARNNCGPQYQQEARRRDRAQSLLRAVGRGGATARAAAPNQFGNLPFATYRTLCVRLCDGYYFPVSFSTLPNHFQRDADVCQSQCAAPAELYYHQNPGGAVEQMVSVQQPAALHQPEIGLALPQGIRAGLLVQGRRVPAAGGRAREEGRGAHNALPPAVAARTKAP